MDTSTAATGTGASVGVVPTWVGSSRSGARSGRSVPVGLVVPGGRVAGFRGSVGPGSGRSGRVDRVGLRDSGPGGIEGGAGPGGGRGVVMYGPRSWPC